MKLPQSFRSLISRQRSALSDSSEDYVASVSRGPPCATSDSNLLDLLGKRSGPTRVETEVKEHGVGSGNQSWLAGKHSKVQHSSRSHWLCITMLLCTTTWDRLAHGEVAAIVCSEASSQDLCCCWTHGASVRCAPLAARHTTRDQTARSAVAAQRVCGLSRLLHLLDILKVFSLAPDGT